MVGTYADTDVIFVQVQPGSFPPLCTPQLVATPTLAPRRTRLDPTPPPCSPPAPALECVQEAAAVFIEQMGATPLADRYHIFSPAKIDAKRDQNSLILGEGHARLKI